MTEAHPAPFSDSRTSEGMAFGGVRGFLYGARARLGAWLRIPGAAWARLVGLLLILCLIKSVLLVRMGKHLFETHWRVAGGVETNWTDYVAFGTFVCLGVLSLIRLGVQCRAAGVKAV